MDTLQSADGMNRKSLGIYLVGDFDKQNPHSSTNGSARAAVQGIL